MADKISRDVFKIEDQNNAFRFGAKFLGSDGWGQKWSGEFVEMEGLDKDSLIGHIIKNSEGKEFKLNKIEPSDRGGQNHQGIFWIEEV